MSIGIDLKDIIEMKEYKLYKGAWIFAGNPNEEKRLSKSECQNILRGGVYS